jgi:hypothetical protein
MVVVRTILMGCAVLLVGCAGERSEAPEEQGHTEATETEAPSPQATTEEDRCEGTRTYLEKNMDKPNVGLVTTTNDLPGCPKGGLLSGTDRRDSLDGKKGDDEIRGLRGRGDEILGGDGNDVIYGGPDNEARLDRGPGDANESWLDGGRGDDVIYAGDGDDRFIFGAAGDDVIYGGDGIDQMGGEEGQDVLHGGDGDDRLDGSDRALLDNQRDELYCGKGRDEYVAGRLDYVDSSCEKEVKPPVQPQGPAGGAKDVVDCTNRTGKNAPRACKSLFREQNAQ